ncbi:MAG: hypothetical protein U1F66_08085 [bacterium]
METVQSDQATALQDRLAWIRNWAFRDSRAVQAYDIPQIRRFFYLNPERHGAIVLATWESLTPPQRGELHLRALEALSRSPSNPFENNALFNPMVLTVERALGEETYLEEWATAAQTLMRRGSTLLSTWSRTVDSANNHDLSEAYFYLFMNYQHETQEFRMGPESSRPALLRSLAAAHPPLLFSDTEIVNNLVRYIALVASSRRMGRISFVEEINNSSPPILRESNSLRFAFDTALDSEDPLDNARLRHRAIDLARDYLRQGSSLPLAQRINLDRLNFGLQLSWILESPGFGPALEAGLRNSLYPPSTSSAGALSLPNDLQRIARDPHSSMEISMAQIPATWRQAARSIEVPGGQNLETLIDTQVRSVSLVSPTSEYEFGIDFLARHFLVNASPRDHWDSFIEIADGAYRLSMGAPDFGATPASPLLRARNQRIFENLVRRQLIERGHRPASQEDLWSQVELAVEIRFLSRQLGFLEGDFEIHEQPPLGSNREPSLDWEREYAQQISSEDHRWRVIEEYHRLGSLFPSLARQAPTVRHYRTPTIRHQPRP